MRTVAVIGGGASGMLAALTAAEDADNRVVLFERQQRLGRKLLATGNGRCNLTNTAAAPEHYHGAEAAFVRPALAAFGVQETLDFFEKVGAREAYITHLSHQLPRHELFAKMLPPHVHPAYDGLVIG